MFPALASAARTPARSGPSPKRCCIDPGGRFTPCIELEVAFAASSWALRFFPLDFPMLVGVRSMVRRLRLVTGQKG